MRLLLTDLAIRKLGSPPVGQADYWDATPGLGAFGCRVSRGGTKTFVLKLNNLRQTIGRYPALTLAQARAEARRRIDRKHLSGHTVAIPFQDALDLFVEQHCKKRNKPSTAKETERVLRKHFNFQGRLENVTAAHINRILDDLTPGAANHAFTAARTFFNWCVRRTYLNDTPLRRARLPYSPRTRDRVLTDDELRKIWTEAINHGAFGTIVRLLIVTGQRLNEITSLRREWIKTDTITFPPAVVKNNTRHTIPVTPMLRDLIERVPDLGTFLFPAPCRTKAFTGHASAKQKLDAALTVDHWTLHDLRRTFSTMHARIGTPPHITELLLNHKTSHYLSPIAKIYNRFEYWEQQRHAMLNYVNFLQHMLAQE